MKTVHKQLGLAGLLWSGLVLADDAATKVTDPHFKLAPGYLPSADLPLGLALLGAPPKPDSAALARDEEHGEQRCRYAVRPGRNSLRRMRSCHSRARPTHSPARWVRRSPRKTRHIFIP